jgi:hypothetical protein
MAEVTEQIIREAPEIEALKVGLIKSAQTLSQQPLNLPAYQTAGLSGLQQQASNLATRGIGSYAPFVQAGQGALESGIGTLGQAAQGAAAVNVAPQYATAQQAMERGLGLAGAFPGLAQAAAAGLPAIGAGIDAVSAAQGRIPYSADLATSQAMMRQGAAGLGGGMGGYDPTGAQAFMNPYQQAVTQNALQEMRRQADIAGQSQAARAVASGAFGGTREGVQRAEFERGVQDVMGQRIMQDYAQNFAQAQQAAQNAFEQQQQRQLAGSGQLANIGGALGQQQLAQSQLGQAGAGLLGQLGAQQAQLGLVPAQLAGQQANIYGQGVSALGNLGQGIGSLAGQFGQLGLQQASTLGSLGQSLGQTGMQQAALGEAVQKMGLQDISTLSALGQTQQQAEQARLDALRATQTQQAMTPYQQLSFLSDIYKGAPGTQMSLTAGTAPSTSPLLQAAGLGISGLAAATGAQKAGLFG